MQEELPVITSRWPCQSIPLAMKPRDIQPNKRHVHPIKIKYCMYKGWVIRRRRIIRRIVFITYQGTSGKEPAAGAAAAAAAAAAREVTEARSGGIEAAGGDRGDAGVCSVTV